jgi:signal peptidase II
MILYYIVALVIIGVDQLTKYLTLQHIPLHESIEVIPGVLSFTHHRNTGAAWSILEGQMWFFYIVTLVVVAVILYYLHTEGKEHASFGWALTLLLGGAVGNFIDRLFHQFVVDMFRTEFIQFPIFNVADIALTFGVIVMIIYLIADESNRKKTD